MCNDEKGITHCTRCFDNNAQFGELNLERRTTASTDRIFVEKLKACSDMLLFFQKEKK